MITIGNPDTSQCANVFAATTTPSGDAPSSICSSVPSAWSAANRRPSDSRLDSSAATQMTPGAIARSRFGSAPTPSGNRLATMTKNSSATATSLFCRTASSRFLRITVTRPSPIKADLAALQARFLVRRKHRGASTRDVLGDEVLDRARRVRIQRRERLIEQPERRRRAQHQSRERGAPALSLRQFLQQDALRYLEPRQRVTHVGAPGGRSGKRTGDREVFLRGELVLQRRRVAEIDELGPVFFLERADGSALPAYFARCRRQQP